MRCVSAGLIVLTASTLICPMALAQIRTLPSQEPNLRPRNETLLTLADGRKARIVGGKLLLYATGERAAPAPAGEYRTSEGRVLHVTAGGVLIPASSTTASVTPHQVPDNGGGKDTPTKIGPITNPYARPLPSKVQATLQVSHGGGDATQGPTDESGNKIGVNPDSEWHSSVPINNTLLSLCNFRWRVDAPASVKHAHFEIAGVGDAADAPNWSNPSKSPPPAASGIVEFTPKDDGWSRFDFDFKSIYEKKNFTWAKADHFLLRITPLWANGSAAGPPSSPVLLIPSANGIGLIPPSSASKAPPPTKPLITALSFTPAVNFNPLSGENGGEAGFIMHFVVTRKPNQLEKIIADAYSANRTENGVKKPGPLHKGDHFFINFSPASQDVEGWDAVGNFVSGIPGTIENALNFFAKVYNDDIKGQLISIVASTIGPVLGPIVGPDLSASLAKELVNAALVTCGIPPTLPDAAALQNVGADYIIASAADQAGVDIPDEARGQIKKGIGKLTDPSTSGVLNPLFYAPDPAYLYHPPVLLLQASFVKTTNYSLQKNQTSDSNTYTGKTGGNNYDLVPKNTDPSKDKLKTDPNANDPDLIIHGPQTPGGGQPPPPKHQDGQNVNEPKGNDSTGSSSSGSGWPAKSKKAVLHIEVHTSISFDLNKKTGGSAFCDENTLILTADVNVPPVRLGESFTIPVILRFPPNAAKDSPGYHNWFMAFSYGDMTKFYIDGGYGSEHSHTKSW